MKPSWHLEEGPILKEEGDKGLIIRIEGRPLHLLQVNEGVPALGRDHLVYIIATLQEVPDLWIQQHKHEYSGTRGAVLPSHSTVSLQRCTLFGKGPHPSQFQDLLEVVPSTDLYLGVPEGVHPDRAGRFVGEQGGLREKDRVSHLFIFCDNSHVSSVIVDLAQTP